MHPRAGALGRRARQAGRRSCWSSSASAARAPAPGRRALLAWHSDQLLGRLVVATTHLLTRMHYRGLLRVVAPRRRHPRLRRARRTLPAHGAARRDARASTRSSTSSLRIYAPLPAASLVWLVSRLRYAVPQWRADLQQALRAARKRAWPGTRRRHRLVLACPASVHRRRD